VDDAICAVRASKDGGVVAGGGTHLNRNCLELDTVTAKSISALLIRLMSNANALWEMDNPEHQWATKRLKKLYVRSRNP
jgi:hypothetical protein